MQHSQTASKTASQTHSEFCLLKGFQKLPTMFPKGGKQCPTSIPKLMLSIICRWLFSSLPFDSVFYITRLPTRHHNLLRSSRSRVGLAHAAASYYVKFKSCLSVNSAYFVLANSNKRASKSNTHSMQIRKHFKHRFFMDKKCQNPGCGSG